MRDDFVNGSSLCRRKPEFPASLTDLSRYRKSVHGHDGSSRIIMVRKTDQRTFLKDGEEPKLETITRETIETFRGQRTECKITTEKKDCDEEVPAELVNIFNQQTKKPIGNGTLKKKHLNMNFELECLNAHNDLRDKHGLLPLKLNKDMCKFSQQWAKHLISQKNLSHSNNKRYGENIFFVSSYNTDLTVTGDEPVKSWYEEIKNHTFYTEPKSLASGHFTQVVWKETRELGVAFAKSNGKVMVVANYYPAGNIIGQFAKNVPPVGGFLNENGHVISKFLDLKLSDNKQNNGTESNFDKDFLNAHNDYRRRHGVPPLKLDKKLCKYSEEWAKILASRNNLEHRRNSPYGENIYCMYSSDPNFTITGHTPVDIWYDEIKCHPFGKEPSNLRSGHFSQLIWKTSEFLGVGVAKSRSGSIYVVANYSPAGNFLGNFADNVPPLVCLKHNGTESNGDDKKQVDDEDDFDDFAKSALRAHNEYRRKHAVPIVKLTKELCAYAQEWADNCAKTNNMVHRSSSPYGENIFSMYSSDFSYTPSGRDPVKMWYDEVKTHTYGTEKINFNTLHFTQVVWAETTEMGIAFAKNQKGYTYVVANYNPRGNIQGKFYENVLKLKV